MAKRTRDISMDDERTQAEQWDARVVWRTRVKAPIGIDGPSATPSTGWNPFDIWHSRIKPKGANDSNA